MRRLKISYNLLACCIWFSSMDIYLVCIGRRDIWRCLGLWHVVYIGTIYDLVAMFHGRLVYKG